MMSAIAALAKAAHTEVEAGGFRWRLSVVRSEDLIRQGVAMLSLMPSRVEGESPAVAEEAARALQGSPDAAVRLRGLADGMVCAAVRAVAAPDGEWEPVTLVLDEASADDEATREARRAEGLPARVWLPSLPVQARDALYHAAMAHNTDGGRLANALASFRGGPDSAATGGPAVEAVRTHAA